MIRTLQHIILFLIVSTTIFGQQSTNDRIIGVVTFKASKNIYVRFSNTESISIGDTLYFNQDGALTPCMTVEKKSSSSCICLKTENCTIEIEDEVVFQIKKPDPDDNESEKETMLASDEEEVVVPKIESISPPEEAPMYKERIRARASAATYSNLSNEENGDRHRTMLRFSLNADHINNSRLSVETFINYRKNFVQGELPQDYTTSFLNIYNLAITYDIDSTMNFSVGRKINRKISSVGPIDGIQVEKYFSNYFTGAVAGFKPDFSGFGFNTDLYEYGGYIGHHFTGKKIFTMTTFGFLEQHNGSPVDRRYLYLQHSSTISKNLSFFSSAEVDIYDNVNGITSSNPRLTNLYISTRYRPNRRLSFMLSYDARKRIIYYETLRTDVERLLADDEHRQGIRGRINFKPFKYINTSVSYSKRFQSDSQNKSDNINFMLSHSRLPVLEGRFSLSVNLNESNYLRSRIMSVRYSRPLIRKKVQGDFYYRVVQYAYGGNDFSRTQYYFGTNLSLRLTKSLRLSILGELSTRESEERIRINTKLIKRFKS